MREPADGLVTNLDLRRGAYATAGHAALALVDTQSVYVEGYFEEAKLPRIHAGARVRVVPMGGERSYGGVVDSVSAGIAHRDRSTGANAAAQREPHLQLGAARAAHPGACEARPDAAGRACRVRANGDGACA